MKARISALLSLALLNGQAFANSDQIDPATAKAYEGYLLTFVWPDKQSTEQIRYDDVLTTQNLLRLETTEEGIKALIDADQTIQSTNIEPTITSFKTLQERLEGRVEILSNQQWTLIFKESGDTIEQSFYSEQIKDGYPELVGDISIKLGRYLESTLHYKHYLFDSFSQPEKNEEVGFYSENSSAFSDSASQQNNETEHTILKAFEPSFVLNLTQSNKTASKKLNYLDHPIIGTLLYFEPIELDIAMAKTGLQTIQSETGESLSYDALQGTNELTN